MKFYILNPLLLTLLAVTWHSTASAVEFDYGGFIANDLRIEMDRSDSLRINRNETVLGGDLKVDLIPDTLRFVGDLKFAWIGFTQDTEFSGLTTRAAVSPYYLESDAAYVEVLDLVPGVDMRIGRQIVHWGTADMFNPTNNLNALDLEDPLKFGEAIANQMVRIDWMPGDNFIFTGVWIPVFQPAMLPESTLLAIGDPASELPFADPSIRRDAEKVRNLWLRNQNAYDIHQPHVRAEMPGFNLANSQLGLRVLWTAGLFDMSLSYYQGINPMPVPAASESDNVKSDSIAPDGTPKIGVQTDVTLVYPRKKVLGFDLAGQLPFLDDAGFWFEGAFVFPEEVEMEFDITAVSSNAKVIRGTVIDSTPYFKFTAGMDYTINQHLFVTGQFIRGFFNEFGAHNINYYWVAGCDIKLLQERILLRLFFVGELPHEDDDLTLDQDKDGFVDSSAIGATNDGTIDSYVIFPQITYVPLDGFELTLAGYFLFGHKESTLAQDAAGASLVVFRARASF